MDDYSSPYRAGKEAAARAAAANAEKQRKLAKRSQSGRISCNQPEAQNESLLLLPKSR